MVEHTRTLGFWVAFAFSLGLGTTIAPGTFSLSGTAVASFVLAALVAGVTATAYSEFTSIYADNGAILVIGASRTRGLQRWVLGSTPDWVIRLAEDAGMPLVVDATETTVRERGDDWLLLLYRYVSKLRSRNRPVSPQSASPSDST